MILADFFHTFINQLKSERIDHCVLRNYDGLPFENIGNDIDLLINKEHVDTAIDIILSINNITVTSLSKRPYVVSVFIYGIEWGENRHALQLDLVILLAWKGISYLSVNQVLKHSLYINNSDALLKKPAPFHEALISFFSSYLVGGWIKDKYQENVQKIFILEEQNVLRLLTAFLPLKKAEILIGAVINDDRNLLLSLLPSIRRYLIKAHLSDNLFRSARAIITHYSAEMVIRYTPFVIDTICFLGADGSGKSTVISAVANELQGTTKIIAHYHLKPTWGKQENSSHPVTNPHAKPARSALFSAGKIIFWLFTYWIDRFFHGHKNPTLKIWDRYYYDLLIDPKRYRYGAPMWFAKMIGTFVPEPDLIILLDAPAEVIYARKKEVPLEETVRQRKAYLAFAHSRKNCIIIDTNKPVEESVAEACKQILDYLERRTQKRLGRL
ncbi:hypothetical protein DGMP_07480 [Desulfomarina profundi]|uniref:Thymidylate kinase-like domain-containing protein n=1 Tax=Desulfomarina profundi TaxID=2772557 RepID=A0A8D5FGC0_9BACT|nr:hypothetical protein [Desulfomarina profundi]BCL60055.1 hypothetical protein DGMP_07480 [Desulfomarina profundi]